VPKNFPWPTLFQQAYTQETTTAANNPQIMGKDADCYIALHGAIEMYFAVMQAAWELRTGQRFFGSAALQQ